MRVCKYDQYLIVKQKLKESAKEELTFVLFNIDEREKVNKFEDFLSFIGYSKIFWINEADVWQFELKEILLIWGDFSDSRASANQKINLFQSNISFLLTIPFSTTSFPKFCSSFIFYFIFHIFIVILNFITFHITLISFHITLICYKEHKANLHLILYCTLFLVQIWSIKEELRINILLLSFFTLLQIKGKSLFCKEKFISFYKVHIAET